MADGKRKASADPPSPAATKRVKHADEPTEPEKKPVKIPAIPFPEKVGKLSTIRSHGMEESANKL
jgi:histone acetyltransferase